MTSLSPVKGSKSWLTVLYINVVRGGNPFPYRISSSSDSTFDERATVNRNNLKFYPKKKNDKNMRIHEKKTPPP